MHVVCKYSKYIGCMHVINFRYYTRERIIVCLEGGGTMFREVLHLFGGAYYIYLIALSLRMKPCKVDTGYMQSCHDLQKTRKP